MVITISRQYGSGGRQIGSRLAERLGIPFYDSAIIELAAKESGLDGGFFTEPERSGGHLSRDFLAGMPSGVPLGDKVYLAQHAVIRALAQKGACVIVGRGASGALRGLVPLLSVFVYADIETRKRRAIEEYGDPPAKIEERIAAIDKKRAAYFKFYAGDDSRHMVNYRLCIDSGFTGIETAVKLIETAYLGSAVPTAKPGGAE